MPRIGTIMLMLVRLLVVVQVILGLMMWFGGAKDLSRAHEGIGIVFVLAASAVAAIGARAGAPRSLVTVTLMWAIITLLFGYSQVGLITGSMHWIIRIVHLVLGLGLAGQAERVARAVKKA